MSGPVGGRLRIAYHAAMILGCLAFAAGLAVFAATGTHARYWADDYCYNAVLRADGFWKAQVSFYLYTSDRYSVIPLVGISELFGDQTVRWWPAAAILLAAAALGWALGRLPGRGREPGWALEPAAAQLRPVWAEPVLVALAVLFFTLWQAPNLFQILYWRTGMLTYFMPLILLTVLAGLLLGAWGQARLGPGRLVLVFLLAFFAGGFSETNTALQAGALGLALAGALAASRRSSGSGPVPRRLAALSAAALLGTLAAMLVLYLSPSNQLRLVHMPEPASLPVLLTLSLRYGLDFMVDTLSSQPLPTLVSFVTPLALALAYHALRCSGAQPGSTLPERGAKAAAACLRRHVLALAGVVAVTYLLIVCVCAPSVYVEVAYPEPRALIAARMVMVAGLAAAGWLSGSIAFTLLRQIGFPVKLALAGALLLLALASLYPLRAANIALQTDLPYYQQRAAGWDARDRFIREAVRLGETRLDVPALDSIGGLMELTGDPRVFPNTCAAAAYGLHSITGTLE